jgi:hypothetical protein
VRHPLGDHDVPGARLPGVVLDEPQQVVADALVRANQAAEQVAPAQDPDRPAVLQDRDAADVLVDEDPGDVRDVSGEFDRADVRDHDATDRLARH